MTQHDGGFKSGGVRGSKLKIRPGRFLGIMLDRGKDMFDLGKEAEVIVQCLRPAGQRPAGQGPFSFSSSMTLGQFHHPIFAGTQSFL